MTEVTLSICKISGEKYLFHRSFLVKEIICASLKLYYSFVQRLSRLNLRAYPKISRYIFGRVKNIASFNVCSVKEVPAAGLEQGSAEQPS